MTDQDRGPRSTGARQQRQQPVDSLAGTAGPSVQGHAGPHVQRDGGARCRDFDTQATIDGRHQKIRARPAASPTARGARSRTEVKLLAGLHRGTGRRPARAGDPRTGPPARSVFSARPCPRGRPFGLFLAVVRYDRGDEEAKISRHTKAAISSYSLDSDRLTSLLLTSYAQLLPGCTGASPEVCLRSD